MCQAKIQGLFGAKYKCLIEDHATYEVSITYQSGHKKGKNHRFTRTLCKKHAKIFRYNLHRKRDKGHTVIYNEIKI